MQDTLNRSPYIVRYRKRHIFPVPPSKVWSVVEEPDLFTRMWPWMKQPMLHGESILEGTRLEFVIDPPFPYRMRVEARFVEVVPEERIEAAINGDLVGSASAAFSPHPRGTRAEIAWRVELKQKRMRVAARVARPVLVRGHDWAVNVALRGFRKELRR